MADRADAPIDEATLDELLESTGGDRSFLADLIETYLVDAPGQIAELRRALQAGSTEDVARAAHALKGASGSLGAKRLFEEARALELSAREGRLEESEERIETIAREFERVAAALRAAAATAGD
jgi:HPt (histidine-containing phosphotransfer) domain-containing protein